MFEIILFEFEFSIICVLFCFVFSFSAMARRDERPLPALAKRQAAGIENPDEGNTLIDDHMIQIIASKKFPQIGCAT